MRTIDKINQMLDEKGISGSTLASELGLSHGTYSQWNTGRTGISKKNLKRVADYLGVPVSALKDDSESAGKELPAGAMPVQPGPMIPVLGAVRCGRRSSRSFRYLAAHGA